MMMILMPNLVMTFMFNLTKHPVSMTITIILQTLILSLSMSLITKTFWMSYILFLVFLGGMLILFLYITSIASNELFSFQPTNKILLTSLMISMPLVIILYFKDQTLMNLFNSNSDTHPLTSTNLFISTSSQHLMLLKLYNTPTSILTIILMIYLFLTLIAIVKITNIFLGPLRSK
uniref:NADH dehydrogenase subunit 6 n=1 Tax=Tympanophyllum maximum TaxID=3039643 RepID=UPI002551E109|nr:NADH dehydrogenase subunit 6 [Tympanophyllum maximum]WFP43225.1 NADH dehydrogenase subunit 6 [Tympanophyllum maximum]